MEQDYMIEWNTRAATKPSPLVLTADSSANPAQLERAVKSSPRPFVLVNERELSVLRRGLTKDGWKRALYLQPANMKHGLYVSAGILSVANQWLEREIVIPERGGDAGMFVCECGAPLCPPDDLQISASYTCSVCSRTVSGEVYDGAVRHMQHMRLAGAALTLALTYGIEKERAYADKAAEILVAYARLYSESSNDPLSTLILHNSQAEAEWAIALAQAYDLVYYARSLTEEERASVEQQLLKPIGISLAQLDADGIPAAWHLAAAGVIGLTLKDAQLIHKALALFREWISNHISPAGLWAESANGSHFKAIEALIHFAEGLYRCGIDVYSPEHPTGKSLKCMFVSPLHYMYPSFRLPIIDDGCFDSFLPLDLYEVAYRRWNEMLFAWVLKKGYKYRESPANEDHMEHSVRFMRAGFYAFLFGRDLPGRIATPMFKSRNFSDIGVCCLKSLGGAAVTIDYGSCHTSNHLGKLGFTLYANDEVMVPDYGAPEQGQKLSDWCRSTACHNTVLVDGNSQEPTENCALVGHCGNSFLQAVECAAVDCYPGVTHTRTIILLGDACIVRDQLSSEQDHDYDWLMRCEGKPEIIGKYSQADAVMPDLHSVKTEMALRLDESCRIDWKSGNGVLSFTMWHCDGGGAVSIGECFAETMNRTVPLVRCHQRGKQASFLAVLAPARDEKKIDVSLQGSMLRCCVEEIEDYVYLQDAGDNSNQRLQSDAKLAAVRLINGEPVTITLCHGSWVMWDGNLLIDSPDAVECIEMSFEERGPNIKYRGPVGSIKLKTNARAVRINGVRTAAANSNGWASLRITPPIMLASTASIMVE
ncbi:heparinase II/III family protein [bacterium]|nr:heparinase II/III family protein [bacterium]